jgi:hypothetical protein
VPTPQQTPAPPADPPPDEPAALNSPGAADEPPQDQPHLEHRVRGRRLARKGEAPTSPLTPEQRLLVLDAWRRSGLPAGDFAPLVGVSKHTLYAWKKKFEAEGPAGLLDKARGGPAGSRLPVAPAEPPLRPAAEGPKAVEGNARTGAAEEPAADPKPDQAPRE